ncbi:GL27084 [Drosophila persimilis]|uniref:GL27084 n=1 Tax=Drosophila persimilis TaxID=7234 RepID=B4HAL2_DROPE|nr:GL27084 [Drosophila persimilis]
MSGTQGGCAPEAQTQTQTQTRTQTRTQAPVREHMFKRPPPYPQPQQPQIPEHLEYQYTLRETPKEEELSADLSRQEARRLQRGQLQQKIKIKQIRMLQRRIQKNTMEIESLQNQMKSLELLMARPPQMQPQLQPRPRPHPQLRKQQAFDLYRPYI